MMIIKINGDNNDDDNKINGDNNDDDNKSSW